MRERFPVLIRLMYDTRGVTDKRYWQWEIATRPRPSIPAAPYGALSEAANNLCRNLDA